MRVMMTKTGRYSYIITKWICEDDVGMTNAKQGKTPKTTWDFKKLD